MDRASEGTCGRLASAAPLARHEGRLPRRFGQVTTISAPDTRELETLAGPGSNVLTVPNGGCCLPDPLPEPSRRRGSRSGEIAFGPNDEALRFF